LNTSAYAPDALLPKMQPLNLMNHRHITITSLNFRSAEISWFFTANIVLEKIQLDKMLHTKLNSKDLIKRRKIKRKPFILKFHR